MKRIIARWQPQAWINDYAVDVDGAKEFDVTEKILGMTAEEIRELRDNRHESDELASGLPEAAEHSDCFYVAVEESILDFFEELGFDEITEEAVRTARAALGD